MKLWDHQDDLVERVGSWRVTLPHADHVLPRPLPKTGIVWTEFIRSIRMSLYYLNFRVKLIERSRGTDKSVPVHCPPAIGHASTHHKRTYSMYFISLQRFLTQLA